jgi:Flp pilus assembly protein TadD
MSFEAAVQTVPLGCRAVRLVGAVALSLSAAGCSSLGDDLSGLLTSGVAPQSSSSALAEAKPPQDELQKATEYWADQFQKKPQDLDAALSYAKNLKALGQKGQAMGVLQQVSLYHATDRRLASEYGRLALEMDQVKVADKLLALADDATAPDWRVVSARGTVLAKQGKYAEAIPVFERALKLAEGQPSVLNNLALAHALNGDAAKAEDILRRVNESGGASARTRQNLALVLGLQGKYDEATRIASTDLPPNAAAANTALVRQIVKLEPKATPNGGGSAGSSMALAGANVAGFKTAVVDAPQPVVAGWSARVATSGGAAGAKPVAQSGNQAAAAAGPAFKPAAD